MPICFILAMSARLFNLKLDVNIGSAHVTLLMNTHTQVTHPW